jgi:GntR family transcriptional regulator, transcriptional repressor for pyruvate dehydrogenase complex
MTVTPDRSAEDPRRFRGSKIPEMLAHEVLDEILDRELKPGDRLPPEAAMIEQYGVGKGSLREALRILEILGIIILKPGRRGGPVVVGISSKDYARTATFYYHARGATVGDLLRCRTVLESTAARIVAERSDAEDIRLLRDVVGAELSDSGGGAAWELDIRFHHLMAQLSSNPILELSCSALVDAHFLRVESLPPAPRKQQVLISRAHAKIIDSAEAGNALECERLMREHVGNMATYLENRYPTLLAEIVEWH